MVLKLLEAIEGRWRAVNGPYLVTLVPVGARFQKAGWSSDPREEPIKEIDEVAR
ncbi:MAG TPA: hypothetical protein VNS83_04140 [Lapillicoccus sp.]|jgi:hypothetical protein|nr:hypothetical protein [Lapillicoccus sp.]